MRKDELEAISVVLKANIERRRRGIPKNNWLDVVNSDTKTAGVRMGILWEIVLGEGLEQSD